MVAGFDNGNAIQQTTSIVIQQILSDKRATIPLILATDSHSLYDCMVKLGSTAEKRLMIDVMGLRQSYERREINEIVWIDGKTTPADVLTKNHPNGAFKSLVETNQLQLITKGWVERSN